MREIQKYLKCLAYKLQKEAKGETVHFLIYPVQFAEKNGKACDF